ncbi:hypothetical protein [Chitinibacter sp. GC72]|uniref:hypothetical protein n=1 Tax=Chitinibacter sp. GC72 TaxID=1526917 RepID=UPI0012FCAABE|nr:hypothetical protein [Chitinibacter sp. GC72]
MIVVTDKQEIQYNLACDLMGSRFAELSGLIGEEWDKPNGGSEAVVQELGRQQSIIHQARMALSPVDDSAVAAAIEQYRTK